MKKDNKIVTDEDLIISFSEAYSRWIKSIPSYMSDTELANYINEDVCAIIEKAWDYIEEGKILGIENSPYQG